MITFINLWGNPNEGLKNMLVNKQKILLVLITLFLLGLLGCQSEVINVLILSGKNNHNWQLTTPRIQNILEGSGRFRVKVTDNPENIDPGNLDQFDVILSNWNTWPDVTGHRWNQDLEKSFLEFIASGKGFVVIHAGSSTLQDWPEFQQIAGGTWGLDITGHGPIHTFKVNIDDKNHPVMKGLKDFYIVDELWHRTKFQPDINIIGSAFSSPEKKGTGKNEPVVITTQYGKGRGFYCVLGHNEATMQSSAWKTLLLRGTEWAAAGEVTIPAQEPWPADEKIANSQSHD
jgi:type 1 glutamine amidotransferase